MVIYKTKMLPRTVPVSKEKVKVAELEQLYFISKGIIYSLLMVGKNRV